MALVDMAVQTVHVTSQSLVTAVDPASRSSLVAAYMVCYSLGSAVGAASSSALHAAHGWAGVAILHVSGGPIPRSVSNGRSGERQRRQRRLDVHRSPGVDRRRLA
jgi:hypothetical protein